MSVTTNVYNGFETVDDPLEYMNAPAMIMVPEKQLTNQPEPELPPILAAAIDSTKEYEVLSADDLQKLYTELNSLNNRFNEAEKRLEVQLKLRDAAQNISRLNDVEANNQSNKSPRRLSRLLGQDNHKTEKRKSRAEEEVAYSSEKIDNLRAQIADLTSRKFNAQKKVLEHHSAVMARALAGQPVRNHKRELSDVTTNSLKPIKQRQSWIIPTSVDISTISKMSGSSTARPSMTTLSFQDDTETDTLVSRIIQSVPEVSIDYTGDNKMEFILNAFDAVTRDLSDAKMRIEAYQDQIANNEEHIKYLNDNIEHTKSADPDATGKSLIENAELQQLRNEISAEHAIVNSLQVRLKTQRTELMQTTKALEDVMGLAVKYESERSYFEHLIQRNEDHISKLEAENTTLIQQKLSTSQNTGLLCQEFRQIIGDLVLRHQQEIRDLHAVVGKQDFTFPANHIKTADDVIAQNPEIMKNFSIDSSGNINPMHHHTKSNSLGPELQHSRSNSMANSLANSIVNSSHSHSNSMANSMHSRSNSYVPQGRLSRTNSTMTSHQPSPSHHSLTFTNASHNNLRNSVSHPNATNNYAQESYHSRSQMGSAASHYISEYNEGNDLPSDIQSNDNSFSYTGTPQYDSFEDQNDSSYTKQHGNNPSKDLNAQIRKEEEEGQYKNDNQQTTTLKDSDKSLPTPGMPAPLQSQYTGESDTSKASSFYPDQSSANVSQVSFANTSVGVPELPNIEELDMRQNNSDIDDLL